MPLDREGLTCRGAQPLLDEAPNQLPQSNAGEAGPCLERSIEIIRKVNRRAHIYILMC